jgi:DNA-directed RNA polymerase specialized sigma24 family protein
MSHDNQSGILRLHSHRTLADDGAPQMTEAWLTRLNRNSSGLAADDKGEGDAATLDDLDVDRKEAALARLRDDYALLYGVVYLTDLRGLSLRETGRHLRLDHKTVKRHRAKGVAYVRALCNEERRAG